MSLTDMVIMPGADYQDACDAIREKTGGTEGIKSGQMGGLIRGISGGGGDNGGGSDEEWIGDGNTHIWIHLEEGRTSPMLGVCPNGTVVVDWGDGTTPDRLTGTSVTTVKWTPTHNYAAPGDYVITLTVGGEMGFYGSSSSNQYSGILRHSASGDTRNYFYRNAVQKIEVGYGVTSTGDSAFRYCYSLASIAIPDGVTSIGLYAFQNCYSLASIAIPDGVTSIGGGAFSVCYSLASVTIPDGVTSIGSGTFRECYSLASVTIPDGVTSIGSSAFQNCYGLGKLRFESATPPTLSNSSAFAGIPTDCIISVPVGSLAAYTAATNYPPASTYTYIEED